MRLKRKFLLSSVVQVECSAFENLRASLYIEGYLVMNEHEQVLNTLDLKAVCKHAPKHSNSALV
jgi:hypothetical protein